MSMLGTPGLSAASQGLAIFAPTADQRYLMGADVFLRTHFPMTVRRYENGHSRVISEDDLLAQILDSTGHAPGNRLWVLYGAPGSGKSELIKLLETRLKLAAPTRTEALIRISRTELDVLSILERFQSVLGDSSESSVMRMRWNAARQKPRTLTKLILLFALETTVDSDELINALFYRLVNVIQPHVERTIAPGDAGSSVSQKVELLSLETWEEVLRETAIAVPIEYEVIRHQLTEAFRQHLFGGLSLTDTLGRISREVRQRQGCRPILLIDDLVQSLSLYATDLLDYFLTLESGDWDVVVGLTPAAFEDSKRGRLLLQRISHLDTIDDRVEKLWLSDEAGQDSYVLSEQNCHLFAAPYLAEFRRLSGVTDASLLYPFNREVLVRVYRGLPPGKGKARYFLRHLRSILEQVTHGEPLLAAVAQYARAESMARCEDRDLAAICELFGPIVGDASVRTVTLPGMLLESFGLSNQDIIVPIEPLLVSIALPEHTSALQNPDDEEKRTVRDWLFGRPVNRQLLKGVRRGVARWLRMTQTPELLSRVHIAKPHGVLRWQKTYLETRPPVCLEGIDEGEDGISLRRSIGATAFDLHRYAAATGHESKSLVAELASSVPIVSLMFGAFEYQARVTGLLVEQVGMSIEELALCFFGWLLIVDGTPPERPPGFSDAFWSEARELHKTRGGASGSLDRALCEDIKSLFEDYFKLRENVYDGPIISVVLADRTPIDLLERILQIEPRRVDDKYRLGNRSLPSVLETLQKQIRQQTPKEPGRALSPIAESVVATLLGDAQTEVAMSQIATEVWPEIQSARPDLYSALRVRLAKVDRELLRA